MLLFFPLILICGLAALIRDMEGLAVLLFFSSGVYLPLVLIGRNIRAKSFEYFISLMVALRLISLPFADFNQEKFNYSGWSAIKNFNFTPSAYIDLIMFDAIALYLITIIFYSSWFILRKNFSGIPRYRFDIKRLSLQGHGGLYGIKIAASVAVFIIINFFIFRFSNENNIGIPGIQPNSLPYKLTGALYFYEKFAGPFLLYKIIKNTTSKMLICILSLFLLPIAIFTLSRSTVAFWSVPLILINYLKFKSRRVVLIIFFMILVGAMMAQEGRNLMFMDDNGSLALDHSISLVEVFDGALVQINISDFLITFTELISRVGGGQELILGSQVMFPSFDYSLQLLVQLFTVVNLGFDYESLVQLTHGFIPLEGAVASLAYSGFMLAYLNTSPLVFILFSIATCGIIYLSQFIREILLRYSFKDDISNFICFALNFIFFGMVMAGWYWAFIFIFFMLAFLFQIFFYRKVLLQKRSI